MRSKFFHVSIEFMLCFSSSHLTRFDFLHLPDSGRHGAYYRRQLHNNYVVYLIFKALIRHHSVGCKEDMVNIVLFIRPSSDGTYYGMVMSVRPGLRPSVTVFRTFLLHALMYWAESVHVTFFLWTCDQVRASSISVKFCRSYAPFRT